MTESTSTPARSKALSSLRIAELKELAQELGIPGATGMRKPELTAAIRAARGASGAKGASATQQQAPRTVKATEQRAAEPASSTSASAQPASATPPATTRRRRSETPAAGSSATAGTGAGQSSGAGAPASLLDLDLPGESKSSQSGAPQQRRDERGGTSRRSQDSSNSATGTTGSAGSNASGQASGEGSGSDQSGRDGAKRARSRRQDSSHSTKPHREDSRRALAGNGQSSQNNQNSQNGQDNSGSQKNQRNQGNRSGSRRPSLDDIQLPEGRKGESDKGPQDGSSHSSQNDGDGQEKSGRRRRGRERSRDRDRDRKRRGRPEVEEEIVLTEDDVLLPVAGVLDVLDNYAFIRTSGYLPGANDVYVSLGQVKKYDLRRGDAVAGAVRQPGENDHNHRQKYNALVRLDSINGTAVSETTARPHFEELTALYPSEQLRMETTPGEVTGRVIDLVAPIGKGQRGLIVAPPQAGRSALLKQIAAAITANNPDTHLMVVLVDERPEDVTDMQRSVAGEVISSTFDRPVSDHTTVAELAIERAKRLVELGQDVIVLLDSLTRLTRAYNFSASGSTRTLNSGLEAASLHPPKKFFGAARNLEYGGSLTILATALVETGSRMDEVIFDEFLGTANLELHLDAALAHKRIFPAINATTSATRKEEELFSAEELVVLRRLRAELAELDSEAAMEALQKKVRSSQSNAALLVTLSKTAPSRPGSGRR